jgi:hypothetical protein
MLRQIRRVQSKQAEDAYPVEARRWGLGGKLSSISANKLISDTVHRENVDRTLWVSFQGVPEFQDVVVYPAGGNIALITRDSLQ